MYFGTRRRAHEAVGAVACFSEFSRLRNGCKVNVFRWIFCFLFAALACPAVFGKGGGVSTCEEGADVGEDGEDVGKEGAGRQQRRRGRRQRRGGHQCASSQLFPVPQSAMSGTLMAKACSISLMTSSFTRSSSSGGTLKLSSSCT